jgi:hypothetical protein
MHLRAFPYKYSPRALSLRRNFLKVLMIWQLFARNLLLATQVLSMLLGSEYGLVLVIKPDTNALSPPDDIYCLLRGPTTHPRSPCFTAADSLCACHSLPQHDN